MKKIFFTLIAASVIFPVAALAQTNDPASPGFSFFNESMCSGSSIAGGVKICTICDLLKVVENAINYATIIVLPLAAIAIVYGGFLIMTSGGDPGRLGSGKKAIWAAMVGLAITLGAWLLVNTVIQVLAQGEFTAPWYSINCESGALPPAITSGGVTAGPPGGGPAPTGGNPNGVGCQNCITVSSAGVPIKPVGACSGTTNGLQCTIESTTASKLAQLNQNLTIGSWQVTEAYPPTGWSPTQPNGIHQNACHGNATCVDANFTAGTPATAQNVSNFVAQANAAGLVAVYEVPDPATAKQLIDAGVPGTNVLVVTAITAPHFSVYNNR